MGITGHKSALTHRGDHDVLKVINLGEVTTNLISLIKILDEGGSIEGNPSRCVIKNDVGKVIITGNREKGKMYTCVLKERSSNIIESMVGNIISNDGVVVDRHLSGEEVRRAKEARKMHDSLHISEPKLAIGLDSGCYNNNMGSCGRDVMNAIMLFGKCDACTEGKMKAPKKISSRSHPASKVGERLAMDLLPLGCVSLGGNSWLLMVVDEKSGYIKLVPMKNKTNMMVQEAIRIAIAEINSYEHRVKEISFDNEIVFNSVATYIR